MVPLVRAAAALEAEDILAAANPSLARVVARTVRQHLVTGASRARSVLLTSNDERYQVITAEEISYAAVAFLDALGER
jgi:hypothetical protein